MFCAIAVASGNFMIFSRRGGGEKWKFVGKNTNCFLFVGRAVRIGHGAEAGEGGGEGNGDGTAWARVFFFPLVQRERFLYLEVVS